MFSLPDYTVNFRWFLTTPPYLTLKNGFNHFIGEQAGRSGTRDVAGFEVGTLRSEI